VICFIVILASCIDTSNACHYDAVDLISVSLGNPHGHMRVKGAATSAHPFNNPRDIAFLGFISFVLVADGLRMC
ncbi:hypothetical protein MOJ79_16855, partial [Calidifontimicrobium sp. SYSU G02091]|uniref:hypothetical protein n=1 Tax=Calidifontimicrobium sp. SYSU G02091 TaxID=2926421 RepID=UPI001F53DDBC